MENNSYGYDEVIKIENQDFNIQQILECGQCFRFHKMNEHDYIIIAYNKILRIRQIDNKILLYCNKDDYEKIWATYFDMKRDYSKIKEYLSEKDVHLKTAIKEKYGVRILKQDPWEVLISFIISQNKQIPHIKKIISDLSSKYGNLIGKIDNEEYYSFPTIQQMSCVSEEELRELKVGFRAPYIIDAINKVNNGEIKLEELYFLEYDDAKKILMTIKGVGNKVADCVLLFGFGKYEVFPTDVWIKRIMEYYYFDKNTRIEVIHEFAKKYFGNYAGFAQQYLFYYARDNKIGKEKSRDK